MVRQRLNNLKKRVKKFGFFIPFTLYFFGFAVVAVLAWRWLAGKTLEPGTAYADIFTLLLKIALAFVAISISIAFLSVLISWLYFYLKNRKQQVHFKIETGDEERKLSERQEVKISLSPVLRPFLGFTRIRLKYDSEHYSAKFSLVEKKKRGFFSSAIDGVYYWELPQIKEYHVSSAIIYFEDFFQFFSLAVNVTAENRFFTRPENKELGKINAFPRKTEETTTRIEEIKRVEGEHINYKHFEANDDVRRIVWKIYAKNKELVVRMPEIMDPYASHIYLYASFYSAFDITGNAVIEKPFLNHYKSVVWTIYRQLAEQGFEVRFVPDQQKPQQHFTNNLQEVKHTISTAKWQKEKNLDIYVKPNEAAVLVVSSLADAERLSDIAEAHGNEIIIILVKLSDSLSKQNFANWVEWVFVQQEKDEREMYKTSWSLSWLRPKIKANEKNIEQTLKRFEKPVII
jgi:hypothetical protein